MDRDRTFRSAPASWTKGRHSLIEAIATPTEKYLMRTSWTAFFVATTLAT